MSNSNNSVKSVVDKIVNYIQTDDIQVGSHLPSERRLSEIIGESRGQVRKALSELMHNGMVSSVPQVGTLLKSKSPCVTTFQKILNLGNIDIQSLIEVRVSLEVTAAGLAAKRASAGQIERIEAVCREYEQEARAFSPWHEQNQRFHMEIIKASQNEAIIAIMENLLNDAVRLTRSRQSAYTQERLNRSIREHNDIVRAIKNRDENEAIRAMGIHMRKMSIVADNLNKILD